MKIEIKKDTLEGIERIKTLFPVASLDTIINVAVWREVEKLGLLKEGE